MIEGGINNGMQKSPKKKNQSIAQVPINLMGVGW